MLALFGAGSLVIGRLSAVDGRRGVATLACFGASSLVIARLSAVDGRHGLAMFV